jgi:sugar phosphate isomerase/epimerase
MRISRRNFLKVSALTWTTLYISPYKALNIESGTFEFLKRIGISTSITNSAILASAGYSFVEETVRGFLVPDQPEPVFEQKLALLKDSKLPVEVCNIFLPGSYKCVGPVPLHEEILKYSDTAFHRAKIAGVKIIVFGSGGARAIPEGFSAAEAKQQFISLCKQLAPLAMKYDIIITLEPLNKRECNFINSIAEGAEIVQEVNHLNFRLLADIYHMLMEDESPASIIKYGHLLSHTHIAEKTGRSAPGVNNEDFTPYFRALKEVDYKGRIAIECTWQNIEEQASKSLSVMKSQFGSL